MKQLRKQEIKRKFKEFKRDKEIYVLMENIQYATNVAAMFRTCDAAGVRRIYLTGISKTPPFGKELKQTSRSKEESVEWMYRKDTDGVINELKNDGFKIVTVEITDEANPISELPTRLKDVDKVCFVVGSEVFGVKKDTLQRSDLSVFIPMYGRGASLNVGSSLAVVLYAI